MCSASPPPRVRSSVCVSPVRGCGHQVSILAICDGKTAVCMPGAQDHKRALDGDGGLNTGGMGAYAPAPCLTPRLARECAQICQSTVTAMAEEGSPFVGVLFAGFMLTKEGEPVVLEFNVRMGDPETQVRDLSCKVGGGGGGVDHPLDGDGRSQGHVSWTGQDGGFASPKRRQWYTNVYLHSTPFLRCR